VTDTRTSASGLTLAAPLLGCVTISGDTMGTTGTSDPTGSADRIDRVGTWPWAIGLTATVIPALTSTIAARPLPSKRRGERRHQPPNLAIPLTPIPPTARSRVNNDAAAKVVCLVIMGHRVSMTTTVAGNTSEAAGMSYVK
jgi:hypothetical protein